MVKFGSITEDIDKKTFKKIYYIYGTESYLKRFYVNEIKKNISENDDFCPDIYIFNGKELNLREFTDVTEMFPIISEKKLIIIKDPPLSSPVISYIAENTGTIPEDNIIIIYGETESFDERLKDFKALKKALEADGMICKINTPDASILERWIIQHTKRYGSKSSTDAAKYLLTQIPNDLDTISSEVKKLSSYCFGREITIKDIDTLACKTIEAKTFDLTEAILNKDMQCAFKKIEELYDSRTNEIMILSTIFTTFGNLYKIKILISKGLSPETIAQMLEMKEYTVKKYSQKLKNIKVQELKQALELCAETDILSKSTAVNNKELIASLTAKLIGTE